MKNIKKTILIIVFGLGLIIFSLVSSNNLMAIKNNYFVTKIAQATVSSTQAPLPIDAVYLTNPQGFIYPENIEVIADSIDVRIAWTTCTELPSQYCGCYCESGECNSSWQCVP